MREHARDESGDGVRTTVAIITHNRRESLIRTLDRLQALPERPPLLVVDNGSTDGTAEAVRNHPSGAQLLSPGHNTGAVGRTLAARHAHTPYVAFSDDDSWWEPGALKTAAALFDSYPRLGLLAARTVVQPGGCEDPVNALLAGSPLPPRTDVPGTPVLGFLGCAVVARRSAFLEAGGYQGLLFLGGEETLLAYDLTAAGWGVVYEPSLISHHDPAPGERPGRKVALRRNSLLTAWLRRPLPVALRATAGLVNDWGRGRPGAGRALREILVRLPSALRQRRKLPGWVEDQIRLVESRAARGGPL
ncbi:glycosyltransferase [Streptomyces sp. NPDC001743]|uniref:glycosyltransferase family 2 protein n=1 Tax=Streptomyces sp. NPDC001743 TaxID=3154397 RepID=UPI003324246D